jgi:hypothetical protein
MRNQGVGSWEINLAAFLADLNTNEWGLSVGSDLFPPSSATYYQYNRANPPPSGPQPNLGHAFDDARALLTYRYKNNYLSLKIAKFLFPFNGTGFQFDNIDGYSDGPLQTTRQPINEVGLASVQDNPAFAWSGADNTNRYIDAQELFDTNKTALGVTAAQLFLKNDFPDRLANANNGVSTYNRYTYYRLLSQMGVDSAPEQNKLNLNYRNVDASGTVVPGMETNFIPWTNALQFFTNAADRMLRTYSRQWLAESPSNYLVTYGSFANLGTTANPTNMPVSFGISDIPVYVNSNFVYAPAIQRVLQLAANIYDATTNSFFPSVFRPIFEHDNLGNVFIAGYTGYTNNNGASDPQLALPFGIQEITNTSPRIPFNPPYVPIQDQFGNPVNVYGVPWIIGAKKGFPNFNKFNMQSAFQLTRKLQVTRLSTNDTYASNPDHYFFNQMFNLSLSNQFGVECWNSYTNPFRGAVQIVVRDNLRNAALRNDEGFSNDVPAYGIVGSNAIPNLTLGIWPGYNPTNDPFGSQLSFQIPLFTNVLVITNSTYRFNVGITVPEPGFVAGRPYLTTNLSSPYEENVVFNNNQLYPQPHWILTSSNDLQVFMLDTSVSPNRMIDYVQLSGPNTTRDLTGEIITNYDVPVISAQAGGSQLWNTNYLSGRPIGLLSQVGITLGNYKASPGSGTWDTSDPNQLANEIAGFNAFFGYTPPPPYVAGEAQAIAAAQMSNAIQAAYTPTATVVQHVSWQANDPLVHYQVSDLNWGLNGESAILPSDRNVANLTNNNPNGTLGVLNQSYRPWGGNPMLTTEDQNPYNLALKDPLVRRSDNWDFPTYRFPTIGWLGRVHRGTPWQTVYLKAADIMLSPSPSGTPIAEVNWMGTRHVLIVTNTNPWIGWTGDSGYDAVNTAPVQDRLLFDVFTTALNDNATRGQLSVNVAAGETNNPLAGLAAWSALFSGIVVPTNTFGGYTIIQPAGPAGTTGLLGELVTNINYTRFTFTNVDGLAGSFEHVGDILAAPQMTVQSPFLNWANVAQQANGISDELYEWLPQQLMSLLRVSDTPRYVIYSYGQALKPAPNGIYTGGGAYFGMVTNYQVVAEAATRAVVRFNGVRTNIVMTEVTVDSFGNKITNLVNLPVVTNNTALVEQFNTLPSN